MTGSKQRHLAVIPARGGSKRLPGKNLMPLNGRPLIEWTIRAAIDAGVFDTVMVSTDAEDIANISRLAGAQVPFLRPQGLAGDDSSPVDAALDILDRLDDSDFASLTWLQPTSPLRTAEHIREAFSLFQSRQADAVISVCACEHSPLWTGILDDDGNMQAFVNNENLSKVAQQLPLYHRVNGAIYIARVATFHEQRSFYINGTRTFAYEMSQEASVDIDTRFDLQFAAFLMSEETQ